MQNRLCTPPPLTLSQCFSTASPVITALRKYPRLLCLPPRKGMTTPGMIRNRPLPLCSLSLVTRDRPSSASHKMPRVKY